MDALPPTPPAAVAPGPRELGVGGFLLSGGPAGAYMGVSAFFMSEWGQSVFVRPSLLFGQSSGSSVRSSLGGLRLDVCSRIEGNYARGSGIQLDLCGGVDGGWVVLEAGADAGDPASGLGMPYLDLGPSIDLRAELGRTAVTLRTVAGFDVTQSSYVDVTGTQYLSPRWPLRVELAVSWDVGG